MKNQTSIAQKLSKFSIKEDHTCVLGAQFPGGRTKMQKASQQFKEYSEHATIQGLCFILSSRQKLVGRWFWILAVCFMLGLGMNWSIIMYFGWQQQQVFI